MGYTQAQVNAILYVPFVPATLSVLGSSLILYHIFRGGTQEWHTKHRILCCLSVQDILLSIWISIGTVFVKEFADSNPGWCEAQGFFVQFAGLSAAAYSCFLSLYFVLTIRFSVRQHDMAQFWYFEPMFHVIAIGFPLGTAVACIPLDLIGLFTTRCLIRDSNVYFWVFNGIPQLVMLAIITLSQGFIVLAVMQHLKNLRKYDFASRRYETSAAPTHANIVAGENSSSLGDRNNPRIRAVATQSLLYVAGYIICYVPALIIRLLDAKGRDVFANTDYFPFLMLILVTYPLQGFFNFIIFIRPAYVRLRGEGQRMGWLKAAWNSSVLINHEGRNSIFVQPKSKNPPQGRAVPIR